MPHPSHQYFEKMIRKIFFFLLFLLQLCVAGKAAAQSISLQATPIDEAREWELTVSLINGTESNFTAFQTELKLPVGFCCVEESLEPAFRIATHTLSVAEVSAGVWRFVCYSATNAAITGSEGALFSLRLRADKSVAAGSYSVYSQGSRFARRDGTERTLGKVTASLTVTAPSTYTLTYQLDGETFVTQEHAAGEPLTPPDVPEREGYTFAGWSDLPEVMPDRNVVVTGGYTVNRYVLSYYLGEVLYKQEEVDYGTPIVPPTPDASDTPDFVFLGWDGLPATMPAHDVAVYAKLVETGIPAVDAAALTSRPVYTLSGRRVYPAKGKLAPGIYLLGGKKVYLR